MKRLTAREISNYRGLTGKPRRGMLAIDPSHRRLIEHIRRRSEKCRTFDSGRLEQESAVLRERIAVGIPATSPAIVVRAFAAVCEAVRRSRGIEYYDVQLAGGLALTCGAIAEIQTGEGKTLITALPAYLHALSASGVHVATTNDYLSSRDRDEVQPALQLLGMEVGLLLPQAMWQSGLHQAVEVKEGLAPSGPRETQARVTRQRYSQLYGRLCGMTGTAGGAENEFRDFYAVPVVRIPTHRPSRRHELPALFFAHDEARVAALVADVKLRQHRGQPVLIGTSTIRQSHQLSAALARAELCHAVLNGVQDADEAGIVAQAGQNGRITIATNMAGRGTDIRLDELVRQAGGLHVAAVEFNQSQRIDRQLAGRAARQGDPGSCQFFASADDELIQQHGPVVAEAMRRSADESGRCQSDFSDQVRRIQLRLDRQGFAARRRMVDHESVQEVMA